MFSSGSNGLHDAEFRGRGRHQLHQAHRALGRDRHRVERRFRLDDGPHQVGVDAVALGVLVDVAVEPLRAPIGRSRDPDPVVGLGNGEGLDFAAVGARHVRQDHLAGRVAPGVDLRRGRGDGWSGDEDEGNEETNGHADTLGESGASQQTTPTRCRHGPQDALALQQLFDERACRGEQFRDFRRRPCRRPRRSRGGRRRRRRPAAPAA